MQCGCVGQRLDATFLNIDGSAQDVSGSADLSIYVVRPDLTTTVIEGVYDTDGSDGVLYGITVDGTIPSDLPGRYTVLAYVVDTTDGFTGFSARYQYDFGAAPEVVP